DAVERSARNTGWKPVFQLARAAVCLVLPVASLRAEDASWPPVLRGAVNGTVTLRDEEFLRVPAPVAAKMDDGKIVPFDVAKSAPAVELAFHDRLGPDAITRRLWSSWGDICVAGDGRVYCGLGDHG